MAARPQTDWDAVEFTKTDTRILEFADLLRWAAERDLVGGVELALIARHAAEHPEEAREILQRALGLRDLIYRLFRAIAEGVAPDPALVDQLNRAWRSAALQRRLAPAGDGFAWTWRELTAGDVALDRILWPVIESAVALLTAPELARLKACDDDGCGWLFLDASKNRSRRWCAMSDCGNRAKVRRFRQRKAGTASGT